jgi:hypothetical protein
VSDVFEKGWNVIRFRRTLLGETAGMWQKMQRATHYAVVLALVAGKIPVGGCLGILVSSRLGRCI